MQGILLLVSSLWFFSSAHADCDFSINATLIPMESAAPVCLQDYFNARDLAHVSLVNNSQSFSLKRDEERMQFNDQVAFQLAAQNGRLLEKGRLELIDKIAAAHAASLKDVFGACELKMFSGEKRLMIEDFKVSARNSEGVEGTRRMLRSDKDVESPRWELVCKDAAGNEMVEKSGTYFFVFIDVYENLEAANAKGHYAQFLWSFDQY